MTAPSRRPLALALLASLAVAPSCKDDTTTEDLGTFKTVDGYTGDVNFEVPDGSASAMVWCGPWGDDVLGALWYFDGPGGSLYDGDAGSASFRAEFLDDLAPVVIPQSPDVPLQAGSHAANFWIDTPSEIEVSCSALYREADVGDSASVEVEIVFVGGDVDAASADGDSDLAAALSTFESEWGSGGVEVSYTFKDFAGDAGRFSVVDMSDTDFGEFNDLLRAAAPDSEKSVTFFFVDELNYAGTTLLGLSAGPPGAATMAGTSKSAVVISAADLRDAPGDVGKIMAHEGGHFLGLYHTSEKDGQTHDPISDTAKCDASNDADGNGTMNTSECSGQGAENVMWWTLTSGQATLSGDQGWVVRRNPAAG